MSPTDKEFPKDWTTKRLDPDSGIPFESKIYLKPQKADLVDRITFLDEVIQVPVKNYLEESHVTEVTSLDLNFLEFFGIFLPAAKVLIPYRLGLDHYMATRNTKMLNHKTWTTWTHNQKKWQVRLNEKGAQEILKQKSHLKGVMLTPNNVDYWNALRGVNPFLLRNISKKKRRKYDKEFLELYEANKKVPFELTYPKYWPLVKEGNYILGKWIVVPMYQIRDASRCFNLLQFFFRKLPLVASIYTWFESKKYNLKKKVNQPRGLIENIGEAVIQDFVEYPYIEPSLEQNENIKFDKYFYRNNFITSYIACQHRNGLTISKACDKVFDTYLMSNPKGDSPISQEYIYNRIYLPNKRNSIFNKNL